MALSSIILCSFQRSGINSSGFAGPSTSTSSLSPLENDGKFDLQLGVSVDNDFFLIFKIGFLLFL